MKSGKAEFRALARGKNKIPGLTGAKANPDKGVAENRPGKMLWFIMGGYF